jgi:DNA-directed RNA polymerase
MSSVNGVSGDIKKKRKDTVPVSVSVPKESSSDIEKYIEKQIEIKLNSLLETLPDKVPKDLNIKPIYNLTIKEIYKKTLQSLIDIITDIVDVYSKKDYVNNNNYIYILMNIFTKDDRKIYVGIMLLVLSFIVYFIDGVSI